MVSNMVLGLWQLNLSSATVTQVSVITIPIEYSSRIVIRITIMIIMSSTTMLTTIVYYEYHDY